MTDRISLGLTGFACAVLAALPLYAGETAIGPDLINGDNNGIVRWGTLEGYTSYSVGPTACNIGDENVLWVQITPEHPVRTMNLYRLSPDGRFEQIGMHWVRHEFCALQQSLCTPCGDHPGCHSYLLPQCSNPSTPARSGTQSTLGPRWQINAHTGQFPYPFHQGDGPPFDVLDRRLHMLNTDIDPALNPGARYFTDVVNVAADDAAAGNQDNNTSHREAVFGPAPLFSATLIGSTQMMSPAIEAWRDVDPDVVIEQVRVPNEGLFHVGYRVTEVRAGLWHYEYAIFNLNSHRSARALTIPIAQGVTLSAIGFHDVDYHSGDGVGGVDVDGTDWAVTEGGGAITWQTQTFAENVNANALRWATLYNFRFDANAPPVETTATLGLFVPMAPMEIEFPLRAPAGAAIPCAADIDESGEVGFADLLLLLAVWGDCDTVCPEDFDDSGGVGFEDLLVLLAAWGRCG